MPTLGPVTAAPGLPGGVSVGYDLAAAAVVKAGSGILARVIVQAPGSAGSITLNDSNALVTNQTVTAITQAANAVATLSTGGGSNPFAVGNTITFASVVGMTQINGVVGTVTAIGGTSGAWTVTTSINSTAFTAYASGGTASSFGVGNQILSVPFGSLTAGEILTPNWPCLYGILASAVPTAGVCSVSFT
jgi:hypothetical protein